MTPRTSPRIEFLEPVQVRTAADTLELMALDLSCGGLRIEMNRPLPLGERVSVSFDTSLGRIDADCIVVWNKPFEPINIDGSIPGMGLRFIDVSEQDRARLEDHVAVFRNPVNPELPGHGLKVEIEVEIVEEAPDEVRDMAPVPARVPKRRRRWGVALGITALVAGAGVTIGIWPTSISVSKSIPAPTVPEPISTATPRTEVLLAEPSRSPGGRQLLFAAPQGVKISHFRLENPDRLVVDVFATDVVVPVEGARIGKYRNKVRYVLDFDGGVPGFETERTPSGLVITFAH